MNVYIFCSYDAQNPSTLNYKVLIFLTLSTKIKFFFREEWGNREQM